MPNQALRVQDIYMLISMGSLIDNLNQQLAGLYSDQLRSKTLSSQFYRGQSMSSEEFNKKIKSNIGGFLSVNSFFSATTNRAVGLVYAGSASTNSLEIQSILFEIEVAIEDNHHPFADISHVNYIKDEDEVFCAMGAVFRIVAVA